MEDKMATLWRQSVACLLFCHLLVSPLCLADPIDGVHTMLLAAEREEFSLTAGLPPTPIMSSDGGRESITIRERPDSPFDTETSMEKGGFVNLGEMMDKAKDAANNLFGGGNDPAPAPAPAAGGREKVPLPGQPGAPPEQIHTKPAPAPAPAAAGVLGQAVDKGKELLGGLFGSGQTPAPAAGNKAPEKVPLPGQPGAPPEQIHTKPAPAPAPAAAGMLGQAVDKGKELLGGLFGSGQSPTPAAGGSEQQAVAAANAAEQAAAQAVGTGGGDIGGPDTSQQGWDSNNIRWGVPGEDRPQQMQPERVGGAQDSHGCLTAAGFTWCETTSKCVQPWMETCPESGGPDQTDGILKEQAPTNDLGDQQKAMKRLQDANAGVNAQASNAADALLKEAQQSTGALAGQAMPYLTKNYAFHPEKIGGKAAEKDEPPPGGDPTENDSAKFPTIELKNCKSVRHNWRYKDMGLAYHISLSGMTFGQAGVDMATCFKACEAMESCKQAVFSAREGTCFSFNLASDEDQDDHGGENIGWSSVHCHIVEGCGAPAYDWKFMSHEEYALDLPGIHYGTPDISMQMCFDKCAGDDECHQAVWGGPKAQCLATNKAIYQDEQSMGGKNTGWVSVHCHEDSEDPKEQPKADEPMPKTNLRDQLKCKGMSCHHGHFFSFMNGHLPHMNKSETMRDAKVVGAKYCCESSPYCCQGKCGPTDDECKIQDHPTNVGLFSIPSPPEVEDDDGNLAEVDWVKRNWNAAIHGFEYDKQGNKIDPKPPKKDDVKVRQPMYPIPCDENACNGPKSILKGVGEFCNDKDENKKKICCRNLNPKKPSCVMAPCWFAGLECPKTPCDDGSCNGPGSKLKGVGEFCRDDLKVCCMSEGKNNFGCKKPPCWSTGMSCPVVPCDDKACNGPGSVLKGMGEVCVSGGGKVCCDSPGFQGSKPCKFPPCWHKGALCPALSRHVQQVEQAAVGWFDKLKTNLGFLERNVEDDLQELSEEMTQI